MLKIYGPYLRKDGRKHVILYDTIRKKRTTVSYAKYLLEQHIGRKLKENETVDHIDGDFTNNELNNLQILTRQENIKKSIKPAVFIELTCKYCKKKFKKQKCIEVYDREKRKKDGPFCSKHCVGKVYH